MKNPYKNSTIQTAALALSLMLILGIAPMVSLADDATSSPDTSSTAADASSTVAVTAVTSSTSTPPSPASSTSTPSTPATTSTTDHILGGNASLMNSSPAEATTTGSAATTTDTAAAAADETATTAPGAPNDGGPSPSSQAQGPSAASNNGPVIPLADGDVVYVFPLGGTGADSSSTEDFPVVEPTPLLAPPVNIVWSTDVPATTRVYFSTSTIPIDLSSPYTPSIGDDALSLTHAITLDNLYVGTPYEIVYQSKNADGTIVLSNFMDLDIQTASTTESATTTTTVAAEPFNGSSASSGGILETVTASATANGSAASSNVFESATSSSENTLTTP